MRTYVHRAEDVRQEWYLIDAAGKTLGRLAVRVATLLQASIGPATHPTCTWVTL